MPHSGPWTIVGKNNNKLISLLIVITEYGSGHPLVYIHHEKSVKICQKYEITNQGKNKENDSGRNRTGVHLVLAVPQSLTPHRVLTTWGKNQSTSILKLR